MTKSSIEMNSRLAEFDAFAAGHLTPKPQTELELLKEAIEDGDSCIEAYEQVDTDKMCNEGATVIAMQILLCLALVASINESAGIE